MRRGIISILFCFSFIMLLSAQEHPPVVKFIYPNDNQIFSKDSVHLKAEATDPNDNITKLEFRANDSVIAIITEPPFEYVWDSIPGGYYYLMARVYDSFGYVRFEEVRVGIGEADDWRPFLGYPLSIPGRIEAQYFDNGGEGVAYQESTENRSGCTGDNCRPYENVDVSPVADEVPAGRTYNYMVSHTYPGDEWLEYSIVSDTSAWFIIKSRIATDRNTRRFHFELDGEIIGDTITGRNTDVYDKEVWYNFKNIYSDSVFISKGRHILRLSIHPMLSGMGGGINFNLFDFIFPENNPPLVYFEESLKAEVKKEDGSDVLFRVFAKDNETEVERVEFYKNGALFETKFEEPYEFLIEYSSPESYIVKAKAYDTDGNIEETLYKKVIFIPVNTFIENEENMPKEIYPNPATEYFIVKTQKQTELKVFDFSGRILMRLPDYNGQKIMINHLKPGYYFVNLRDADHDSSRVLIKKR